MEKGRVAMATVSHANQAREWANSLLDGCDGFDPETAQAISEKAVHRHVQQMLHPF
jgi:hypothetical protein